MIDHANVDDFISHSELGPIIDLRPRSEYLHSHLPSAVNVSLTPPPDIHGIIEGLLRRFGTPAAVRCYCQTGRHRSLSFAEQFAKSGSRATVLSGGFLAFTQWVASIYRQGPEIILLSGQAGAGKTRCLAMLRRAGQQCLDLEQMAMHRGSAFGALSLPQPTRAQFHYDLAVAWKSFNASASVWIEDEAPFLGSLDIPYGLWARMLVAPVILLQVPRQRRMENLLRDYAWMPRTILIAGLQRISGRFKRAAAVLRYLDAGELTKAVDELLDYYDQAYMHRRSLRCGREMIEVEAETDDLQLLAGELILHARHLSGMGHTRTLQRSAHGF
jgi:tRNA 2-selenouridine synthase